MIKSIFNENDKTPSMKIDKKGNKIVWYDFSTGLNGNIIDLVKYKYNIDYQQAVEKICEDYGIDNKFTPYQFNSRTYKVSDMTTRYWNDNDINYWGSYHIPKVTLERYNVYPISSYSMSDGYNKLTFNYPLCYSYNTCDGTTYKIYNPGQDRKFIKVCNTIQGLEQLTYSKDILVICSSLKDLMCLITAVPEVEAIAPDSENTPLPDDVIVHIKSSYRHIFTMFDNDAAGLSNMAKYKKEYDIDFMVLNIMKDIADCNKNYGINTTRINVLNILKYKL